MPKVLTGDELRELREARNWSQATLSRRAGVTRNYVSMIENGQRPGSAQFWRIVGRIFDAEEVAAVRRADFLRLGAAVVTVAAVPCAAPDRTTRAGRQIFGSIVAGDSRMFASAQTTHATDLVIRGYVAKHQASRTLLRRWMRQPAAPVLQVNAAGVLAKLGEPDVVDDVIVSLRGDHRVRRLYLTAVAARVLRLPWGQAGILAGAADEGTVGDVPEQHRVALLGELDNTYDGAARWCALTLLGQSATRSRDQLLRRLQVEPSREALRALGTTLALPSR